MKFPTVRSLPLLLALACSGVASSIQYASAQTLPIDYQLQMQVRASLGGSAYNLPSGSTFNSVSASLNDLGKVAVKVSTIGGTTSPAIFFGGQGTGSLVHDANDNAAILGEVFLNNNNQVSFTRAASTNTTDDGVYVYSDPLHTTTRATGGPLGATSYTNPQINDIGIIGMRIKFNTPQALFTFNPGTNAFTNYVTETGGDPNSPYSFIYAPAFNNNNRIAAQVNLTGQPSTYKELRIWNSNGSSILVASGDSSAGPTFYAFDNSISMNNLDRVAFTTRTAAATSARRIVVSDGTNTTLFPTVSSGAGFTSIDSFPPVVNDNGLVAFRGNDNQSTPKDSVFVSNGTFVQRIAGVGDVVPTDIGPREIGFLMGAVDINNRGAVSFGVQFTSGSGGGNAIYVAYVRIVPLGAVSRKTHGLAGVFDIPLPLVGTPGIESRQGEGTNLQSHKIVVSFASGVTFASAAITSGSGTIESTAIQDNDVVVNLNNVANAQTLNITLFNVNDGFNTSDVVIPVSFLQGDVNGDRTVSASDIGQTKAATGSATATNFRADAVANGTINASDISFVKSRAGTTLP